MDFVWCPTLQVKKCFEQRFERSAERLYTNAASFQFAIDLLVAAPGGGADICRELVLPFPPPNDAFRAHSQPIFGSCGSFSLSQPFSNNIWQMILY